jgi:hypothetical protein
MPKPKATTLDPEPEVQEQVVEETPPAEAEVVEQRGDETPQFPELPEEVTFQHLQQHPRFKEDWDNLTAAQKEERNEAYRKGQSDGAKEANAKLKEAGEIERAVAAFDHWEAKRNSDDPYETQEFAKAIAKPEVEAAYQMGKRLRQGPSAEQVKKAAHIEVLDAMNTFLDEVVEKQGPLSDAEKKLLDRTNFPTLGELTTRKVELAIERGIAAGLTKDDAKKLQDAREEGHREAYDEIGLEYPGEPVEGKKPERLPTKDELDKLSVDQVRKLQREGKLDKILAKHK